MQIGDKLFDFNLPATDGNIYSKYTYADKYALLIIVSCNHCPYSRAYWHRIVKMWEKFEEDDLGVMIINGNDASKFPADSFENMKKLDASRLVDFVAGASAALDGDFHKLSEQVYVFCPSNIRITPPAKPVVETPYVPYGDTLAGMPTPSESLNSDLGLGALDFLYPGRGSQGSTQATSPWTNS